MSHFTKALVVAALTVATATGAALADQSKPQPVNCGTAEGDIRALNAEKEHAQQQQLANVASITPAGALIGLVTGTEGKRIEMLTGEYQKKIDERIALIQSTCKVK